MTRAITGVICGLIMVTILATADLAGAEAAWIALDENQDSYFYYDKNGIVKPEEGIIRVTARVVYTEEGKEDALKILQPAKDYKKLSESHYLYDLNCTGKKSKLLRVTHLDDNGAQLKTFDLSAVTEWEEIPPAARLELILELACSR